MYCALPQSEKIIYSLTREVGCDKLLLLVCVSNSLRLGNSYQARGLFDEKLTFLLIRPFASTND